MDQLTSRFWNVLQRFLLRRIILVLTLLFCVGVGMALSNMSRLSSELIEAQAIQNAELYTQSFIETFNLYSDRAADRLKNVAGVEITHDYPSKEGAVPLPSTFAIELGDRISSVNGEVSVRLYSDFPFPTRKERGGGPRDQFERDALVFLRQNPNRRFSRMEKDGEHMMIRYGEASIMQASCVACHNTYPESPKTDWSVGDVGGVWEISQPLDSLVAQVNDSLRGTFFVLGGISVLGLSGLTLVIGKLRQTARELEGRVQERTMDLALVNNDLEQRNQLIRQVFGRYLSNDIVANLLESPEGLKLGGDRRKITILTSDLRGFTALAERISPEEVIHILNLYLEYMADVINKYQGTIDEFMGDGILVLFGAPTTREDDAVRAIACACEMQLTMGAVNERMQGMGLPQLAMGIGINTGEVVVGNIGSEKRTKYGIVGSQVNLTYRIESYTKGGQILISETTLQEAGPSVKINGKQQVQPKGVKTPITIYDVYGISGRYNIYLPKEDEEFFSIPEAIMVDYWIIQGKQISTTVFKGRLVKLSSKGAELQPQPSNANSIPPNFTNLKLNFSTASQLVDASVDGSNEDIYAKVTDRSPNQTSFFIQFTAVPNQTQILLSRLYKSLAHYGKEK